MAAPADYWDEYDLKQLTAGGFVNEDVMQKIWDISAIPLPFTDMIGSDTAKQSYTEWVQDELADPDLDNAVVSGADASGNDAAGGTRVGNHCQNSVKVVAVTERTRSTDVIGTSDEFARQLMMRQQELRRDVEAIALSQHASVADNNNATAGKVGGFDAWLETNVYNPGVGGSSGGFNTTTKVVDAPVPGEARALPWIAIKDTLEAMYLNNATPTVLMTTPQIIKRINTFLLSATGQGYIAQPTANVSGSVPTDQVAQGYVNVMRTDFGFTLRMIPNRLQQMYDSGDDPVEDSSTVFFISPEYVSLAYLKPYVTKPLAKLGLSDRSQISVDWTLKVYVEKAHGCIRDVSTEAVTG